jgi:predicted GIY-YIG superfamily endonuclease
MSDYPGTIYLIHFDRPYRHARHYVGWSANLEARLADHRRGAGSRLMAVIHEAGITWRVTRTRPGDRTIERLIKRYGGSGRYCPACTPRVRGGHWDPAWQPRKAHDSAKETT